MEKKFQTLNIILLLSLSFHTCQTAAMDIEAGVRAGYDNNPSVTDQTTVGMRPVLNYEELPGSAFFTVEAGLEHEIFLNESGIAINGGISGYSSSYFGLGNKRQIEASATVSDNFYHGMLIPYIAAGGSVYRDDPTGLNSVDELYSGIGLTLNPAPEYLVAFTCLYHWLYYKEDLEVSTGHPPVKRGSNDTSFHRNGMSPDVAGGGHPHPHPRIHNISRDERLLETGVDVTFFFMPELSATAGFLYSNLDSSIDINSYDQIRISASFSAMFPLAIDCEAGFAWFETDYDGHTPMLSPVTSRTWSAWGSLSRTWRRFTFSLNLDWRENAHVSGISTGSRMITSAGVEWHF